jgi:hypothetical protein
MRVYAILILFILPLLTSNAQTFWEKCGELPTLDTKTVQRYKTVQDGNRRSRHFVTETTNITFDGFVINADGTMLGYRKEGNQTGRPNFALGVLFRSDDLGKSWMNISDQLPSFFPNPANPYQKSLNIYRQVINSICAVGDAFFILQGTSATGIRLLRSKDKGENWEMINQP